MIELLQASIEIQRLAKSLGLPFAYIRGHWQDQPANTGEY